MKKAVKWIVIILAMGTLLYLGISFFVVSWLSYFSNPERIEALPREKIVFDKLKKRYEFEEISRTPEYKMDFENPKDTLSYELYISYIDCNKSKECYKKISDSIVVLIKNNIQLNQKFYKYKFIFYCKKDTIPSKVISYKFSYLRQNI